MKIALILKTFSMFFILKKQSTSNVTVKETKNKLGKLQKYRPDGW